jgi:hypothetical protein
MPTKTGLSDTVEPSSSPENFDLKATLKLAGTLPDFDERSRSGMAWNCSTGALARLGIARANVLQSRNTKGADADAARVRALAEYKQLLELWKDADADIPIYKAAKAEYAKLQ